MRATQAYKTDGTFRALVDEWVKERRCPVPLVDRCLELGMESAADCCRWASDPVRTPDRVAGSTGEVGRDEREGPCGPYPGQYIDYEDAQWFWDCTSAEPREPFEIRMNAIALPVARSLLLSGERPVDAILALVDLWARIGADVLDHVVKKKRSRR